MKLPGTDRRRPFKGERMEETRDQLIGRIVNLGTKDGGIWEGTTIVDISQGRVFFAGGTKITGIYQAEPTRTLVEGVADCYVWDIARGFVWLNEDEVSEPAGVSPHDDGLDSAAAPTPQA